VPVVDIGDDDETDLPDEDQHGLQSLGDDVVFKEKLD